MARAGTLDNMDWAEPIGNIWTDSKAAWVKIDPVGHTNAMEVSVSQGRKSIPSELSIGESISSSFRKAP